MKRVVHYEIINGYKMNKDFWSFKPFQNTLNGEFGRALVRTSTLDYTQNQHVKLKFLGQVVCQVQLA